jgi:hypothetical protein
MVLAGVAVVLAALVGAGVTYLATSRAAPATPGAVAAAPHAGGHGKGVKGGRAGGQFGDVEHGEFTTASSGVMAVQRGAITAIDATTLTVRSLDGFTASYTITPATAVTATGKGAKGKKAAQTAPPARTVAELKIGDPVQVLATRTDGGRTATRITPAPSRA